MLSFEEYSLIIAEKYNQIYVSVATDLFPEYPHVETKACHKTLMKKTPNNNRRSQPSSGHGQNQSHFICDSYIPCTGVFPNTQFLQKDSLLLHRGFLKTTVSEDGYSTLRVNVSSHMLPDDTVVVEGSSDERNEDCITLPRIYTLGDCADYSRQCIADVCAPMNFFERNLIFDLKAHQLATSVPFRGNEEPVRRLYMASISYKRDERPSQLVPIGNRTSGVVGVLQGDKIPSFLVYLFKGRNTLSIAPGLY